MTLTRSDHCLRVRSRGRNSSSPFPRSAAATGFSWLGFTRRANQGSSTERNAISIVFPLISLKSECSKSNLSFAPFGKLQPFDSQFLFQNRNRSEEHTSELQSH